jgi:hypothetical protein
MIPLVPEFIFVYFSFFPCWLLPLAGGSRHVGAGQAPDWVR